VELIHRYHGVLRVTPADFMSTRGGELSKRKVYSKVLGRASEHPNEILARANRKRVAR
jgi:hypothetical protein